MRTPSFRHMGGKARLRTWLVDQFPTSGLTYYEPFAGKGNVFFKARESLQFRLWHLNDLDIGFLDALVRADLDQLPEEVTRETFRQWSVRTDPIAKVIEPRVTFAGKGYPAGYSGTSGTHIGYSRKSYLPTCSRAQELLKGVILTPWSWELVLNLATEGDFVYCDPPYLGTNACYANINHVELIEALNNLPCKWAISGYPSPLYDDKLDFINRTTYERNSEIKSSNSGGYESIVEVLWRNY